MYMLEVKIFSNVILYLKMRLKLVEMVRRKFSYINVYEYMCVKGRN